MADNLFLSPISSSAQNASIEGYRSTKGKPEVKGQTNRFRYPLQILDKNTDYVQIDCYKYEPPGIGNIGQGNSFDFVIPTSDTNYKTLSKKRALGSIILPMPQSIPLNGQSASWDAGTLNPITAAGIGVAQETIKNGIPGLVDALKNSITAGLNAAQTGIGQNAIQTFFASQAIQNLLNADQDLYGNLLSRQFGAVINENVELLFRGVNIRSEVSFAFQLAPRDDKESEEIKKMVLFLKKEMSPKKGSESGAAGELFLKAPSVFKIQYMSGGRPHPYLNRFKICALKSLSLNFTGNDTYATYSDGTPVYMILTLTFQELTPIYAEDYNSEEGTTGIGY